MGAFDVVWGIVRAALDVVVGMFKIAWAAVTTVINTTLDVIKGVLKIFADLVTGQWGKLWGDVKSLFTSVWNDISGFFKSVLGTIKSTVVGAVSSIFGGFEKGIKDAISGVTKALSDVYNGIVGFFKDAGTWLYDIGKSILTGLINGAKSALGDVKSFFGGIGHDIVSWKGPPSYDAVMLTDNGQLIMQGLMKGFQAEVPALHAQLGSITASIQTDVTNGTRSVAASASALAPARALGSGVTVQTNVYVTGNTVLGDGDADRLATKIGNRLATTTLPGAGRGFSRL
jgi:phage-related protein